MGKEPTAKSAKKPAAKPPGTPLLLRIGMHLLVGLLLLGGGGVGYFFLARYAEREAIFPRTAEPPKVVLKSRPAWMSDELYKQIIDLAQPVGTSSPTDRRTVESAYNKLRTCAWVKQVRQVKRIYGKQPGDTIEIDCEFRAPIALVQAGNFYWAVDNEGVALPDPYEAARARQAIYTEDGRVLLRVIQGVQVWPPEPGQKWEGEDLWAALDLVKLLYDKPYANEILIIDASNFRRQRQLDAQLVLLTKHKTRIDWGEPVRASFHADVDPARKLMTLECLWKEKGRVDGGVEWVDIRKDEILTPAAGAGGARATTN